MRIFVTRGNRRLGRPVVARLQRKGHQVRLLPRRRRIWRTPLPRPLTSALEVAKTSAADRRPATMWAEWLRRSGAALPHNRAA
jgi:nucleoside-diphosphate-sugar epimerase